MSDQLSSQYGIESNTEMRGEQDDERERESARRDRKTWRITFQAAGSTCHTMPLRRVITPWVTLHWYAHIEERDTGRYDYGDERQRRRNAGGWGNQIDHRKGNGVCSCSRFYFRFHAPAQNTQIKLPNPSKLNTLFSAQQSKKYSNELSACVWLTHEKPNERLDRKEPSFLLASIWSCWKQGRMFAFSFLFYNPAQTPGTRKCEGDNRFP